MKAEILIVIVILSEAFLHYFRWKQVLMGRELPRIIAYVLGVLGMMLPFTIWLIEHGYIEIVGILWTVIIAGGLSVAACYGLDAIVDMRWDQMETRQREKVLTNQLRNHDEQGK